MSEFIKSVGRKIRSFHKRFEGVSEAEYVSGSVDRIDLELSAREYARHHTGSRRVLGGACRL